MMTAGADPAGLLEAAAAVIDRNGWYHGGGFSDQSTDCPPAAAPVCAAAAIRLAAGAERPEHGSAAAAPAEVLFARYLLARGVTMPPGRATEPADVIAAWNDAPGRTGEQVAAALRAAARTPALAGGHERAG